MELLPLRNRLTAKLSSHSSKDRGFSMPQLSGQNTGPGYRGLSPNISGRVKIGGGLMPARDAGKYRLVGAVPFVDAPTFRALAGRVSGIDKNHRHTSSLRLIGDKSSKLTKCPITQSGALVAAGRYPAAYAFQVFNGNAAAGAFSVQHYGFRDAVIDVLLIPRLLAGQLAQSALRGLGLTPLQAPTTPLVMLPGAVDTGTRIVRAVAINGQGDDAEINTKPVFSVECRRLWHVARRGEDPLPSHKAQIDLAFSELQQIDLTLAGDEPNLQSPSDGPDGDKITYEPNDPVIVWLRCIVPKFRSNIAGHLKSVGHLCNAANGRLRCQAELAAHLGICKLVKLILTKCLAGEPLGGKPRASSVAALKRLLECHPLFIIWQQLYGGNELHLSSIEDGGAALKIHISRGPSE